MSLKTKICKLKFSALERISSMPVSYKLCLPVLGEQCGEVVKFWTLLKMGLNANPGSMVF